MKYTKVVRRLLLNPDDITHRQQRVILESVFDYLNEEGEGRSRYKVASLMFGLICIGQGNRDNPGIPLHQLSPEAVVNVVKALAYCFPDEFDFIPESALADFRVHTSAPTIHRDDKGVHAMILVTLLDLADDNEAFNDSDSKFDDHLTSLLIEGMQKRHFRNSTILSHQSSLLSSVLKKFVGRAYGMLPLTKGRWNSLCHIIDISKGTFSGDAETKPSDASLEHALLNELCFKIFNTCSLETKAAMLRSHCLSVPM